jgi:CubicO group peptidase (beta-lactamase class C family)
MRSTILTLLTVGLLAAAPPAARAETRPVSAAGDFRAAADDWIPSVLERLQAVPGIAIAVAVGDQVVLAAGYGRADIENAVPAAGETVYYIASATKPFTALMAKILESQGAIDLGSSLAGHLPDGVSLADSLRPREVRLRDLLTHTSGIANEAISDRLAYTGEHDPETLWRLLSHSTGAEGAPLGTFLYTNTGYNILTMILDRETGTSWQDQLQKTVFDPLGLHHTTAYASVPPAKGWPMAAPYFGLDPSGMKRLYLVKQDNTMQSAGGMLTTARDLGRWLVFQLNDGRLEGRQVVDAAVVRATHEKLVDSPEAGRPPFHSDGYGLGWSHGSYRGHPVLMHGGSFPGFMTSVSFMPDAGIGVAVLINEGSVGSRLFETLPAWAYDWWLGTETGQAEADAAVDKLAGMAAALEERIATDMAAHAARAWMLSRPLEAYAGTYASDVWGTVVVTEEDEGLRVTAGNLHCRAEAYVKPETIRVELLPGRGEVIRFEPETGEVDRLFWGRNAFERIR